MEKSNERVLAYNMAKAMNNEELMQVSGGTTSQTTQHPCGRISGQSGSWDTSIDVSLDW